MTNRLDWTTFDATLIAPKLARDWILRQLGTEHPAADDAMLLITESVTNAVLHGTAHQAEHAAGATVTVGLETGGHLLEVRVLDAGRAETTPCVVQDPDGENGRGMFLMDVIAKEWDYRRLDDGRGQLRFVLSF